MNNNAKRQLSSYITMLRKKQNISLQQLSYGLCSASEIARISKGSRMPGKLLQDRLLARLGVSPDDYENFLDGTEYMRWKDRQQLLYFITDHDRIGSRQALAHYYQTYDMNDNLEFQFYLSMQVQLDRQAGASNTELLKAFHDAVILTVPDVDTKNIRDMCLSIHELNLILEYEHYRQTEFSGQRYEELLDYIETSYLDAYSRSKIYPKIVYYLYLHLKDKYSVLSTDSCIKLLSLSGNAIDLLRNSKRLYYLRELLCARHDLLLQLNETLPVSDKPKTTASLSSMQRQTDEWLRLFDSIYEEFAIPKETDSYCYLYEEKEVYCIGDVIRIRREMLGISRAKLADGICSEKTLRRLEHNQVKTQQEIVGELFLRLNLSAEYSRTELITDTPSAVLLMDELRCCSNGHDCENMDQLLKKLEQLVPMQNPINRQVRDRFRVLNEQEKGNLSNAEYLQKMLAVLELTLPQRAAFCTGEKYMTKMEKLCIHNLARIEDTQYGIIEKCVSVLQELYIGYEREHLLGAFISMYELIMGRVASYLGNQNQYDASNKICTKIIKENLRNKRATYLSRCIYNIWWNENDREKRGIPNIAKQRTDENLHRCVLLSSFYKEKEKEQFYKKKIEDR